MQLAFVLDCSNGMLDYIHHFKKKALKWIQEQHIDLEIALVIYRPKKNNLGITDVETHKFRRDLSSISDLIPSRESSPLDKTSLHPTDIHKALGKALDFKWDSKKKKRTLILIGKNPPNGVKYHKLGNDADPHPFGTVYPDDTTILTKIGDKQIDFFIINMEDELQFFFKELMKTKYKEHIAKKWVQCVTAQNKDELTQSLLDCLFGNESGFRKRNPDDIKANAELPEEKEISKKKEKVTSKTEEQSAKHNEKKTEDSTLNDTMRWVKESNDRRASPYPVLVVSVDKGAAIVWDGASPKTVDVTDLCRRSDFVADTHSVRRSDIAVKQLLKCSHAMGQTLIEERNQCKKYKNAAKEIMEMIHSKIKCHDNIKWHKRGGKYHPVLMIQSGTYASFVLDTNNIIHKLYEDQLFDSPPYQTAAHIANHVETLDDLCANYPWKNAIELGVTECKFLIRNKHWYTSDSYTTVTGVIKSIESTNTHYTQYAVRRHDNNRVVSVQDNDDGFEILSRNEYIHMTTTKNYKKELNATRQENKTLTSKNNTLNEDIRRLRDSVATNKATVNSLQSDNDHLQSRIQKSAKDIARQKEEIDDLKIECHKAITNKEDLEKQYKRINNVYDRLKQESNNLKKEHREQRKLVTKLREDRIEHSSALDLSRGFPPVQDIVSSFDTVKSHYYVEAAKVIKKALKQSSPYKEYSKLRNYKIVCEILFNILMKSYDVMKEFEEEKYRNFAKFHGIDIDDEFQRKKVEKMVKESYESLINQAKRQNAERILNEIHTKHELSPCIKKDDPKIMEYTEQCIAICWKIVLVRDPMLSIGPTDFNQSNEEIMYDDRLHIEGFGSDTDEPLNFVVWPSIIRQDTKYNISKTRGVFIKEIPKWKKKKRRKKKNSDDDDDKKGDDAAVKKETKKKEEAPDEEDLKQEPDEETNSNDET